MMSLSGMRASTREAVEEALGVLAARDVVYWDVAALRWVCTIPLQATIRTALGEMRLLLMRNADGVLICAPVTSANGHGVTAYLTSRSVAMDASGEYVEVSLLRTLCRTGREEADEDSDLQVSHSRGADDSTRDQPRRVDLRGCFLDHSDMARVSKGLAGNCFLAVLSLSGNHLQDSSISLLADALLHNGVLQELNLSYNEIGVLGSTLLATALADHRSLTLLDLMHNRIGRDGLLPWLGRTLRTNRVLQELRLTHNDIGDAKSAELVAALASAPTTVQEQLKTAVRRRTVATAAPTMAITAGLPSVAEPFNATLTTLLLGNTGLSHDAAHQLSHVLAENKTLTHLDLSSNALADTDHESFARGVKHNHVLRYLNYSENRITHEPTGVTLLRALRCHATIETALFQDCFHGSSAAVAMAEWLRITTSLLTLDVSHCMLEPPGVVDFYRAIGENRSLGNLDMTCMGIKSDQAVAILSASVAANKALRVLNLSYNEITLRGVKALREAAAPRQVRLALEGNSGEKPQRGVHITGGSRPVRLPMV